MGLRLFSGAGEARVTDRSSSTTVLVVDDEPQVCEVLQTWLSRSGFDVLAAADVPEAIGHLESGEIGVMVADIHMPGQSGLDLLAYVRDHHPRCHVVIISGMCRTEHLARALSLGAYDYLMKPLDMQRLESIVAQAASSDPSATARRLPKRAADAMRMEARLRQTALEGIRALVRAVEAKDPYTRMHSEQVAYYAREMGEFLGDPVFNEESVRTAALLHDVGKIGVPDEILTKPGPLTDEEFDLIRQHPILGAQILGNIPQFSVERLLVRHHHERWDGRGYPDGLAGDGIPLGARLLHVVDAIDAMLMSRTYKEPYPVEKVLDELDRGTGSQFDPHLASQAVRWCQERTDRLILPTRAA